MKAVRPARQKKRSVQLAELENYSYFWPNKKNHALMELLFTLILTWIIVFLCTRSKGHRKR
jgi:hypothetical protein